MAKGLSKEALEYFRQQGAKGGKKLASQSTAAERKARATNASKAAALARTKKKARDA
jgi:hypothetical protein